MTAKIKFPDGVQFLLPDISYEKFMEYMPWIGSSDMAYREYLRSKGMMDLSDFNADSVAEAMLVFEDDGPFRVIEFACISDTDLDE